MFARVTTVGLSSRARLRGRACIRYSRDSTGSLAIQIPAESWKGHRGGHQFPDDRHRKRGSQEGSVAFLASSRRETARPDRRIAVFRAGRYIYYLSLLGGRLGEPASRSRLEFGHLGNSTSVPWFTSLLA